MKKCQTRSVPASHRPPHSLSPGVFPEPSTVPGTGWGSKIHQLNKSINFGLKGNQESSPLHQSQNRGICPVSVRYFQYAKGVSDLTEKQTTERGVPPTEIIKATFPEPSTSQNPGLLPSLENAGTRLGTWSDRPGKVKECWSLRRLRPQGL